MVDRLPKEDSPEQALKKGPVSLLRDEWPGLVVLLALFGFFASVLFGQDTLFYRDLYRHYIPIGHLLAPAADSTVSLLWDPYLNGGQPWLANPNRFALYPSRLLYLVLSPLTAFHWEIFLHHFLGTLGTYVLARRLQLRPAGAATAAAVWAFSGVSISIVHLGRFLGFHALPFAALAVVGICRHRRWGWWFGVLTGSFFLQLLSGAVELLPVSLLLTGAMVVGLEADRRAWLRPLFSITLSLVLAIGLAAVQIVPAVHFLKLTARAASEVGGAALDWSFAPLRIVEVLVPGAFGPLDLANPASAYWGAQIVDQGIPLLVSVYGGSAAVLFAILALIVPTGDGLWRRLRWALAVAVGLSVVAALAASIPFARALFDAAGWLAVIRYPVKFLMLAIVPSALLAGWGVHRLTTERGRFAIVAAALAAAAAAVFSILSVGARFFPRVAEEALFGFFDCRLPGMLDGVIAGLDHSALALFGVVMSAGLFIRGPGRNLRFLPVGLVLVDLVVAASAVWFTGPRTGFATMPPVATSVRRHLRDGVLFRDANPTHVVPALPGGWAWGSAAWWSATLDDHLATRWAIPTIFHLNTSQIVSQRVERLRGRLLEFEWRRRLDILGAAGMSVILTYDEISDPGLRLEEEYSVSGDDVFRLYRTVAIPSRHWIVQEAETVEDGERALAELSGGNFDPGRTVILERTPLPEPSLGQRLAGMVGIQRTLFGVEVELAEDGYLVLALPWHPEIAVSVDGTPSRLEHANYAFSAVSLPAGRHRVEIAYRPGSVFWGAALSVVSLLICFFLLFIGAGREERRRFPRGLKAECSNCARDRRE